MKNKLLLFAVLLFTVCTTLFAQYDSILQNPTTEEEYNYVTKGYRVQVESGLDMKKGYTFINAGSFTDGSYSFDFKILQRTETKESAGILVVAKSTSWGNTYYLCIPKGNPALMDRYYGSLNPWDSNITKAYARVLSVEFVTILSAAMALEGK